MKLTLYREEFSRVTIGSLFIDGKFCCHTLEPKAIDWTKESKVYGQTAIPEGTYDISFEWSCKFNQNMPFLTNVPQFLGVMIHQGNFGSDTQGCILVGWRYYVSVFGVYDSAQTMKILQNMIRGNLAFGTPTITVTSKRRPKEFEVHPNFKEMYERYMRIRYQKK